MKSQGFTLIEILISLLLLSLALLGLDAMQVHALRTAKVSYNASVAMQQLTVMTQRLRVIKDKDYQPSVRQWNLQNQQVLPQSHGFITGTYPHYRLSISWGDGPQGECKINKIGSSGCLSMVTTD